MLFSLVLPNAAIIAQESNLLRKDLLTAMVSLQVSLVDIKEILIFKNICDSHVGLGPGGRSFESCIPDH